MKVFIGLLAILIFITPYVSGAAIGVSKAQITMTEVLKGGYAEDSFSISTDNPEDVVVKFEFLEDVQGWGKITQNGQEVDQVIINRGNIATITVVIQPPNNIPNGKYNGVLRVSANNVARTDGQFGSVILAAFRVRMDITITGRQIQDCVLGGLSFADTEIDNENEFTATIRNKGNVNLNPTYDVAIWNQDQTKLIKSVTVQSNEIILPTQTKKLFETVDLDLGLGQYFADVSIQNCQDSKTVTFQVLNIGEIADQGELIRVYNNPWAKTLDIIPITADFKNNGERSVNAKLKGTISLDGDVVKVIDTEPLLARPGETITLQTFFQPEDRGQYFIKARVLYNEKLTFEKESLINVNPSGVAPPLTQFKLTWYPVVLFVLVVIALTLILLIKKNKRPRHKRIKF